MNDRLEMKGLYEGYNRVGDVVPHTVTHYSGSGIYAGMSRVGKIKSTSVVQDKGYDIFDSCGFVGHADNWEDALELAKKLCLDKDC